jgi:hypothetical protein
MPCLESKRLSRWAGSRRALRVTLLACRVKVETHTWRLRGNQSAVVAEGLCFEFCWVGIGGAGVALSGEVVLSSTADNCVQYIIMYGKADHIHHVCMVAESPPAIGLGCRYPDACSTSRTLVL